MEYNEDTWNDFARCCEKYPSSIYTMIVDFSYMLYEAKLLEKISKSEDEILKEVMILAYAYIRKNRYADDIVAERLENRFSKEYEIITGKKYSFDTKQLCISDDIAAMSYQYCVYKLYNDWQNSEDNEDVKSEKLKAKDDEYILFKIKNTLTMKVPEYLKELEETGVFSDNRVIEKWLSENPKILEAKKLVLQLFGVPDGGLITDEELNQIHEERISSWKVEYLNPDYYTKYESKMVNAEKVILYCLKQLCRKWNENNIARKYQGINIRKIADWENIEWQDFQIEIPINLCSELLEKNCNEKAIWKLIDEEIKLSGSYEYGFYAYKWFNEVDWNADIVRITMNPFVVYFIISGKTDFDERKIIKKENKSILRISFERIKDFISAPISYKFKILAPVIMVLLIISSTISILDYISWEYIFGSDLNIFEINFMNIYERITSFIKIFNLIALPILSLILVWPKETDGGK